MNGSRKNLGVALRKVLLRKDDHGIVKHVDIIQAAFLRAFSFVVNNAGFRKIVILPSALNNTPTEVNVFSIHEERFIQQSHPV